MPRNFRLTLALKQMIIVEQMPRTCSNHHASLFVSSYIAVHLNLRHHQQLLILHKLPAKIRALITNVVKLVKNAASNAAKPLLDLFQQHPRVMLRVFHLQFLDNCLQNLHQQLQQYLVLPTIACKICFPITKQHPRSIPTEMPRALLEILDYHQPLKLQAMTVLSVARLRTPQGAEHKPAYRRIIIKLSTTTPKSWSQQLMRKYTKTKVPLTQILCHVT